MAESTGWGGEFWLHNGTALAELVNVTGFTMPEDMADEIDVTTLKAAGRRKMFILGMIDGGTFEVEMNYIPNSGDDQLCRAAHTAGDSRPYKIAVPDDDGTPLRQFTGNVLIKGYRVNQVRPNEAMTATLTCRVNGAVTEAAYT